MDHKASDKAAFFGRASITPQHDAVAGIYGTWTIALVVGHHGIGGGGRVLLARHNVSSWGIPQTDRPGDAEYTTVRTSGAARLQARYDPKGYIRPWRGAVVVDVCEGSLVPGDTVTITLGDTSCGGPGSRAQTFRQERFEFRILVDAFCTGEYVPVADPPCIRVIGGPAVLLRVRAQSDAVVGESFSVTVVAEDAWGNPAEGYRGTVELVGEGSSAMRHVFSAAERGVHRFDGVSLPRPGTYRLEAHEADGGMKACSNPVVCHGVAPAQRLYWGDIHGQTEATVGTGTLDEYFHYASDIAALDFVSHCANDFQITAEHWNETREAVRRYHRPGHHVTFLAYEWSGITPAGGDHNVYYSGDEGPLHRSSHWQVPDRSDVEMDCYPLSALHTALRGRNDVLVVPHVGGRLANMAFHDPEHTPLIEICSMHGVFEWFATEALRRGLRVGFIAASDDHTCRPGASSATGRGREFGVRGGLMAAYAGELTRAALWEAFWARRCYATTGERIVLRFVADGHPLGAEFAAARPPLVEAEVIGTAPLESVELLDGGNVVYTHPLVTPQPGELPLLKVLWEGARAQVNPRGTCWDGSLTVDSGRIRSAKSFAFDSPEDLITEVGTRDIRWRSMTSGDRDGLFVDISAPDEALVTFRSEPATFSFRPAQLAAGPLTIEAGGEGQRVTVSWSSSAPRPLETRFAYRDESASPGPHAYWVRVVQRDGGMAWSSPIYVNLGAHGEECPWS